MKNDEKRIKERRLPTRPAKSHKTIWKHPEKTTSTTIILYSIESEEKTNNQGVSKRPAKTPTAIVI